MALRNNTWKLNESYDQDVAGNADYVFPVEMWASGSNGFGFLGDSTSSNQQRSSPIQVPGSWQAISTGMGIKQTVTTESTLWCWGYAANGQNGDGRSGDDNYMSSPVQVPGTNWRRLVNSWQWRGALKNDGTLWMWGSNQHGRLGLNDTTQRSSPTQVGTNNNWKYVSASDDVVMGIKTDGTLWGWGNNNLGELAQNNRTQYSSPKQIPGTTWDTIHCWRYGGAATKTDGTAWTWGYNEYGQLMQNNRVHYSSPVQVPGTDWSSCFPNNNNDISAGNDTNQSYVTFQKTNGSIWYAGSDNSGAMGLNCKDADSRRSSPVEVGAGTAWAEFTRDFVHATTTRYGRNLVGVKSNGQMWACGSNSEGEMGLNNMSVANYSSPIQIPGTWSTEKGQSGNTYYCLVMAKDP